MVCIVNMYRLKVSLLDVPVSKLHRVIDIAGNAPFSLLHDMIFEAFDRYDPHLYKFLLTYCETKSTRALFDCKELVEDTDMVEASPWADEDDIRHDARTFTLDDAKFKEKDFFYYWFDFGDDWLHRIKVEKIFAIEEDSPGEGFYADIVKSVGESPPQYGEDSVWASAEEEDLKEKMFVLLATLGTPEGNALTWQSAMQMGVAESMLASGLVDAIDKPDDPIALNAAGKHLSQSIAESLDNPGKLHER